MQEQGCQKINPLEFINNPGAFFKQCQEPTKTQSSEPIEYLKVPKLDSGISVTVTKFWYRKFFNNRELILGSVII